MDERELKQLIALLGKRDNVNIRTTRKQHTMIIIIRSEDRHTADFGWLRTHWHFSFGDYRDSGQRAVVEAPRV
jgi:hypothetical protein